MNGNQKNTLRFIAVFLILLLAAGCAASFAPNAPVKTAPVPVTVLFFNDLHGFLEPFDIEDKAGKQEVGGIARMATLVREIRLENDRRQVQTVLLIAGDILQGTLMSTVFQGGPEMEVFNAMGVDALTVGNHEFDFGLANFHKLKGKAAFPFLSANILEKASGLLLCPASQVIPLAEGLDLTVIGVTTEELMTTALPASVVSLSVNAAVPSLKPAYDAARLRGPVLLLSHCGIEVDEELAAAYPGLTAIIGGHDHLFLSPYQQVGSVPIFQTLENGRYLGRVDFQVDPVSRRAVMTGHRYLPVTTAVAPDPRVAAIVASYQARLGERFKEVIGRAAIFLDGERDRIRSGETPLGNFVTDTMRAYTGAQIAFINAGTIRASIKEGPVTLEDLFKTISFPNELVVTALTGAEIQTALTRAVRGARENMDGGFLQVSGLNFEIRGYAVENIRIGPEKEPLDPQKEYKVAITDFLATGGDDYKVFPGKPQLYTGLPLRELLVDTIRRLGVITAAEEGRIHRLE